MIKMFNSQSISRETVFSLPTLIIIIKLKSHNKLFLITNRLGVTEVSKITICYYRINYWYFLSP